MRYYRRRRPGALDDFFLNFFKRRCGRVSGDDGHPAIVIVVVLIAHYFVRYFDYTNILLQ